jgi:hypothetical protein
MLDADEEDPWIETVEEIFLRLLLGFASFSAAVSGTGLILHDLPARVG